VYIDFCFAVEDFAAYFALVTNLSSVCTGFTWDGYV
jgi:hypothetical protein